MAQTWSLNELSPAQRTFLNDLRHTGSTLFIHVSYSKHVLKPLEQLGIIEVDDPADGNDLAVSFTEDGEQWIQSLPKSRL